MPIQYKREGASVAYLEATVDGITTTYRLAAEGDQFLTSLLGLKDGDEVRSKDLTLLLERRWATLIEAPPEPAAEVAAPVTAAPILQPAKPQPPRRSESSRPSATRRTRAREVALQVLYQWEQNASVAPLEVDRFIARRLRDTKLQGFAHAIVAGVREHQTRIDELISNAAENWRIDRMAAIDRNILRLGAYEMLYDDEVPTKVAINEALELAKRYSTAQSSRFVNGILDRLQNAGTEGPAPAVEVEPEKAAESPE